jgi:alkylation response protein AidB-like acyl-CoA dehydrogenase
MSDVLALADRVAQDAVAPHAAAVDRDGAFPVAAIATLADVGLLKPLPLRDAATLVERLARDCASTAMVVCMHHSAVAVLDKLAPAELRAELAVGRHLSTLAFSEVGSRSQFWAPLSTAVADGARVRLTAKKSFVTSAHHADSYVWSSRPVAAEGASTLWLVRRGAAGLRFGERFDGLGLRGNDSCAITAEDCAVDASARLGDDGGGFAIMIETVLPWFDVLAAAVSVGLMDAAVTRAAAHAGATRFAHAGSSVADLPTARAQLARARILADQARALWLDTIDAIERGRGDATLRVLEVKAAAGDAAAEVGDLTMRVCGGAAYRKEVGIERIFRDARAGMVMAPTSDVLHDFIGKAICGLPLF